MEKKALRIVHTCPLGPDGITSMVLNICQHLDRTEMNFDYLVYRNQKEFSEDRAKNLGGTKYIADNEDANNKFMKFWLKFYRSYKIFKKRKPDIFHINASTPYDTLIGISAKLAGVPAVVVHSHNSNNSNQGGFRKCLNRLIKNIMSLYTDAYFTCSTEAAQYMFPSKIVKTGKYIFIANGINYQKFAFDLGRREQLRKENGLDNLFVVGHIGRVSPQKNHSFLLEIFKEICTLHPSSVLLLAGTGELLPSIKKQAKKLKISNNIIFWGTTDHVWDLMLMMDAFVLPSLFEGLPVVGIEAQASGLPCVFSDTITKETAVSDRVEYLPLDAGAPFWAEKIIGLRNLSLDRTGHAATVAKSGFDIVRTAHIISEKYYEIAQRKNASQNQIKS